MLRVEEDWLSLRMLGNTVLTLNTYKDADQEIFCKGETRSITTCWSSSAVCLGCYQDKLQPREQNRKELEAKFSKQPGGGANPSSTAWERYFKANCGVSISNILSLFVFLSSNHFLRCSEQQLNHSNCPICISLSWSFIPSLSLTCIMNAVYFFE